MFKDIHELYKMQREQRRCDQFNDMAVEQIDELLDKMMNLCERYVKSQERIANALEKMTRNDSKSSSYTGKHLHSDGIY